MNSTHQILVLVSLFAPLASFLTTTLPAPRHEKLIAWMPTLFILCGFLSAAVLLFTYWDQREMVLSFDWFHTGTYSFTADLLISNRSTLMLGVVSFISLLVHIYSTVYMAGDPDFKRYFAMLGFFTFSMQGIVLSDNLLFLFIFWELVGFSSYMLIGHWTKVPAAGRAATKAFVMNRIGDAGFLVGLMIIWTTYASFNLTEILSSQVTSVWQTAASICIFCGVIGKSAQFPLFTWLPDAMEGPTPVSALIHAATMVAAGVYLMVRVSGLFTQDALLVVAIIGMITTIIGALAALSQYDIKKILAYSTMSQLGLMILAIGMGVVDAAFLHLLTHAFFKACLFLSAGMIIHALHKAQRPDIHFDVQDIRNLGGLRHDMPTAFMTFLISGASLAGVPFFSGFLSKEAILLSLFMHTSVMSWLMLVVVISVSFLTVIYTFRLIWFVFMSQKRALAPLIISEPNWIMRVPVVILALCSLWFMVSWNPFDAKGWMLPGQGPSAYAIWITLFSILWVIAALMLSWYIFKKDTFRTNTLLRSSFYIDEAYESLSGKFIYATSRGVVWFERSVIDGGIHTMVYIQVIFAHFVAWVDRVFVDGTVNGAAGLTGFGGKITRSFQGGNIQLYIFWAVFAVIIFIIWALK